ncbi:MAG: ABC transporter substrate-binding protein [Candidatus Rokubacteria bacterium]|nr:ABC transporter substrate-binding protein [Candidatus Rokubacteria bacterium]
MPNRPMMGLLVPVLIVALASWAHAGEATDQLRTAIDQVLKILEDPGLKKPENAKERRAQLRKTAETIFDYKETSKRALARHWAERNPEEREEFVALFADLLERAYMGKIEQYGGEKISYVSEVVEGDLATVKTKILTKSKQEVPVDYRMLKSGGRWLIYDVIIEGVSLIGNYRNQFNRIIQTSSCGELVNRMKTRQDELLEEGGRGKPKSKS